MSSLYKPGQVTEHRRPHQEALPALIFPITIKIAHPLVARPPITHQLIGRRPNMALDPFPLRHPIKFYLPLQQPILQEPTHALQAEVQALEQIQVAVAVGHDSPGQLRRRVPDPVEQQTRQQLPRGAGFQQQDGRGIRPHPQHQHQRNPQHNPATQHHKQRPRPIELLLLQEVTLLLGGVSNRGMHHLAQGKLPGEVLPIEQEPLLCGRAGGGYPSGWAGSG